MTTRLVTETEIKEIFKILKEMKKYQKTYHVLKIQINSGLKIGDVLQLKLNSFVSVEEKIYFNIEEKRKKTKKKKEYSINKEVYKMILEFAKKNNIKPNEKIFDVSVRTVQRHLKEVNEILNIHNVSTQSFRKFYANKVYENSGNDILLVQELLQHQNLKTTKRYLEVNKKS